ncbi:DUF58 domain-containing protein [Frateuria aurantia]
MVAAQHRDGDGRTTVTLKELLGLRNEVGKSHLPRVVSRQSRSGQQSSRSFGRGMDYAESRAYQAGDDVRRLDWRLTARSGRLHTKLFQEEREAQLLIVLDTHASMQFGTRQRYKSVQAARAAALAAWHGVACGERVGLLGFGRSQHFVRPRGGVRGATAICGALVDWDQTVTAAQPDNVVQPLSQALGRALREGRSISRILLISDGWSSDEAARGPLLHLAQRSRIGVLLVSDPIESAILPEGRYPLQTAAGRVELNLAGDRARHELQHQLGQGRQRLMRLLQPLGLAYESLDTQDDPSAALERVLTWRGGRS